jgi:hypothetical protein
MRTPSASPKTFRAAVDTQTQGFADRRTGRIAEANNQHGHLTEAVRYQASFPG